MNHLKYMVAVLPVAVGMPVVANAGDRVAVDVIKNPYSGSRNVPELSTNPDYIHAAGLERLIDELRPHRHGRAGPQ